MEAGPPRPNRATGAAPRELVLQGDEREGSQGVCSRAQCQVALSQRVDAAVSRKRRLPSGSERANEAKRKPAQCPSCEARTCEFVCRRELAGKAAHGRRSGSPEEETPTAAKKGDSEDEGDESDLWIADHDRAGHPSPADRESYRSQRFRWTA